MSAATTDKHVIRVLIVDDHPVFRAGLSNLLESEPGFVVVAAVGTSEAAATAWRTQTFDVVLLDLRMPVTDGFATLRLLRQDVPDAKAIVLTSSDSVGDVVRSERAGARGFISKNADQDEILRAIRAVEGGDTCFPAHHAVPVECSVSPGGLSVRELEVLGFLRHGHSNSAIGRILGITERTVKAHVAAILHKLSAADRAEAVAKAFELGIFQVSPKP